MARATLYVPGAGTSTSNVSGGALLGATWMPAKRASEAAVRSRESRPVVLSQPNVNPARVVGYTLPFTYAVFAGSVTKAEVARKSNPACHAPVDPAATVRLTVAL